MPIKSYKNKKLKLFGEKGDYSKIKPSHHSRVKIILSALDTATCIKDLEDLEDLHQLKGFNPTVWSVRVSGNYRITFVFENGDASDLDYLDTH